MEKMIIEIQADVKKAVDNLEDVKQGVEDIKDSAEKTQTVTKALAKGFTGVGLAMKAAGFAIIQKIVNKLGEALMRNQEAADTVATAFNVVGIVFNKIIKTFKTIFDRVTSVGDNFDALGRIMKNLMTLAITPLKLAFNGIMLVIKEVQLAWETSWLGKGDVKRIQELTAQITGYKKEIKEAADEAIKSGKGIVIDFREGINEVRNIGKVGLQSFKAAFEDVTVSSLVEQGKAINEAVKGYALLSEAQRRIIEEYDRDAEKQRQIRDDIRLTIDERIEANTRLAEILKEQGEAEVKALEAQKGAIAQRIKLEGDANRELAAQLYALDTEIVAVEAKLTGLASEQRTNEAALLDEKRANLQELSAINRDEVSERLNAIRIEADNRRELARRTISDEKKLQKTLTNINKDEGKKRAMVNSQLQEQKIGVMSQALGSIGALVGQETVAGKALAIAQATIDTYAGATKALAQGGIWGYIGAAGVISAGLANIKTITQTDVPGQADSGGALSVSAPEPVEAAVPTFGAVEAEPPPIQAYVVESDVSSSQALQDDLNLQATL